MQAAIDGGAEHIGLYRTETAFMQRDRPPSGEELNELYSQVVRLAAGKSVTFRTFDIGGDKPVGYLNCGKERTPSSFPRSANLSAIS
nr:PTS system phosphoenolpyruvate-protein phosphotransferase [Raoultella sp. NCTC 9187]